MAPKGKGVIKALLATSYRRWEELSRDPAKYQAEKQAVADAVIACLGKRFPGLAGQIEALDVATPITTLNFTGNAHGYRSSIVDMILGLIFGRRLSETLPGLDGFYMVGQWAGAPGVSPAAAMGRDIVRRICRRDARRFVTFVPSDMMPAPAVRRAA
jgi:phytoene dehydrogenase-like protein